MESDKIQPTSFNCRRDCSDTRSCADYRALLHGFIGNAANLRLDARAILGICGGFDRRAYTRPAPQHNAEARAIAGVLHTSGGRVNVLDLFSGIGGFSLGLERAGMRTVAFCEIDPYCRKVLAKHWPGVPIFDDVRTITGAAVGPVDVICGGFPCQDISSAGAREGIDGERSGLWSEYARIIGELRPRFVVVENVADLLVRGFGRVLGDLAALGYDAEWHCIPAAAVGADHWRDRIWIIAYPNSAGSELVHFGGRQQRPEEMGEDAPDSDGARLPRRLQTGTIGEDARAISTRLGLALCSPIAFPELDGAGSPVLGRGEDGIPDRVDRMHALGNSVVPQIPEIIGRAIMRAPTVSSHHQSRQTGE